MIRTLGSHCGNSRSLCRFSTYQLSLRVATFFEAKIFDNGKYKKHATNKIRSSHPEVFCKQGVLRNFAKFAGKHMCQSFFFNKVAALRSANLLKKRLGYRCFPVNFLQFIRTSFFVETSLAAASVKYNFILK